jgi:limonene-1,2-epoxide hydrolase
MADQSNRAVVERFARAVEEQDFDTQISLLADDYVDEMPQSGERIRGKAGFRAVIDNYPGGVGTLEPGSGELKGADDQYVMTPTFNVLRIEGSGNVFTYSGTIRYANGETWQVIVIAELRGGRIAKTTTWYAQPFEAPEWRAPFVERMDSTSG